VVCGGVGVRTAGQRPTEDHYCCERTNDRSPKYTCASVHGVKPQDFASFNCR